jgi:hypothetical protein
MTFLKSGYTAELAQKVTFQELSFGRRYMHGREVTMARVREH